MITTSQRPVPDNTQHNRQTSIPQSGFESTFVSGERSQTCASDYAATGTGKIISYSFRNVGLIVSCFKRDEKVRC